MPTPNTNTAAVDLTPTRYGGVVLALDPADVQPTTLRCGAVRYSPFVPAKMVSRDDEYWEAHLARPWTFEYDGLSVTLPAGFFLDGASIRYRAVESVITRWGVKELMGAGPHDGLYSDLRHLIPDKSNPRAWADGVLYHFWRGAGVNVVRANLGRTAVRVFGGSVWDKGTAARFDLPDVTKQTLAATGLRDYTRIAA